MTTPKRTIKRKQTPAKKQQPVNDRPQQKPLEEAPITLIFEQESKAIGENLKRFYEVENGNRITENNFPALVNRLFDTLKAYNSVLKNKFEKECVKQDEVTQDEPVTSSTK